MSVLRLQLPTDPRWVNIVEKNIEEILTDHAWCEQKAASNAITIITINSEYPDLVTDMLALAKEEIEHFEMVHEIIKKRGLKLGRERKDEYVGELAQYMKRSNNSSRVSGFVEKLGIKVFDGEFDIIYVNGDNNLANFKKEEESWKVRLIEEAFFDNIFDVKDI